MTSDEEETLKKRMLMEEMPKKTLRKGNDAGRGSMLVMLLQECLIPPANSIGDGRI